MQAHHARLTDELETKARAIATLNAEQHCNRSVIRTTDNMLLDRSTESRAESRNRGAAMETLYAYDQQSRLACEYIIIMCSQTVGAEHKD